jgi:hypothetical protein
VKTGNNLQESTTAPPLDAGQQFQSVIDQSQSKKIIAVCDRAFDVPQHRFWRSPMSHVIAYSDRSVGLNRCVRSGSRILAALWPLRHLQVGCRLCRDLMLTLALHCA